MAPLHRPLHLLAGLLCAALCLCATPASGGGPAFPPLTTPMRKLISQHGKYFGTMANHVQNNESLYNTLVASQYNLVTSATLYWAVSEPSQGQFNLEPTKNVVAFARQYDQFVRCHNLVWHQSLPEWVTSKENASAAELTAILKTHVQTIVTQAKGLCDAYDVVNEPFNSDGSLRDTMWKRAMGDDYLMTILGWVKEVDPKPMLFINDYGIAERSAKSLAVLATIKNLRSREMAVHVGFESHFHLCPNAPNTTDIAENMAAFAEVNATVHVTELDVSLKGCSGSLADQLYTQAVFYRDYLLACVGQPNCMSFETWGCSDRFSWLGMLESDPTDRISKSTLSQMGFVFAPLPWTATYGEKPAIQAMAQALHGL